MPQLIGAIGVIIGAILIIGIIGGVLWLVIVFVGFVFYNSLAFIDKLFGSWMFIDPQWSWALMGFIITSLLYFAFIEAPKFKTNHIRPYVFWIVGLFVVVFSLGIGPQTKNMNVAIEKELIFKPSPYTDQMLQIFLENSAAPENLRKFEKRGRIKNLQKIFSEKVSAVEWSPAVTIPTPPSEKIRYHTHIEILSGQVLIKNFDSVVGKYPDKNFKILKGESFSLRFKSIDHLETGVVVWRWEEHLP